MAELRKEPDAALTLMIRAAMGNGARPSHLAVWNHSGFLLDVLDMAIGPQPVPARFYGLPIKVDPTLREGKVELRDERGNTLGVIENIGGIDG